MSDRLPASCQMIPYPPVQAAGTPYDCLSVAVPARLRGHPRGSAQRLRVVVKGVFRAKGLTTSLNNKAYYNLSTPAESTAAVVESLARDGAHILGMTKLSSMIAHEDPLDAVDFHTAFNPRGDGYQSPAGTSSGNMSGSGRRPALVNGIWQFRPTHDLVNPRGMVPTYALFDTPCLFSRKLQHLKAALKRWVPPNSAAHKASSNDLSYEIVYLADYLPVVNQQQTALINSFVQDAAAHLPATIRRMSIRETWKSTHPEGTPDNVDAYLHDLVARTFYDAFNHSNDSFRRDYAEKHSAAVTAAEHAQATARMMVYRDWLLRTFFHQNTPDDAQDQNKQVLVVLPISNVAPNYRDVISPSPEDQSALDELFLPPILGAPDVVVLVGEVQYDSRITGQREFMSVVVDLVAVPRRDWELVEAVERVMMLSGRPVGVKGEADVLRLGGCLSLLG
ncbi:amidase signature domain-containing protein [Staphylotrichum tortipilum]|uniref:Amidase signature domain-containing protein n=1 Tax=Staphylotrichum tortipilum TaxID=2831512 RepID=A0AAN6RSW1_9PEZI|nr:amidase signature domain-containing protein [Staphylotrichum longicolle]